METVRLRGRQHGADFQVTLDRMRTPGFGLREPVHVVRFVEVTKDQSLVLGEIKSLGIEIASTYRTLQFRR